jgi:hypothetical protein
MRKALSTSFFLALAVLVGTPMLAQDNRPKDYRGTPYRDSLQPGGPQSIPGRVKCAFYDLGGEGVAYHDSDDKNSGSGNLNPLDGKYLNEFRKGEGVDTSYTKFWDEIDNNPYNMVKPEDAQLYVGWTEPGEWFNLSVDVKAAGEYSLNLMYTSNRGGTIGLDLNGAQLTEAISLVPTATDKDPLAWRQWHHWNTMTTIARVKLPKGLSVLTLKVLTKGNMNFDYLEFVAE